MDDLLAEFPKKGPVVAIDGPAGTGKSTAAKRLSEALSFIHVDTGSLYRAIGLITMETGAKGGTPEQAQVASDVAKVASLEFRREPGRNPANRLYANGRDVTGLIRTPEVSMAASQVSAVPAVRASLLGLQRKLGAVGRSILEGRDIGTVVFPDADLKFFLTASANERAKRRLAELEAAGADALSFEEIRRQIVERDQADSTRAVAPLRRAADAVEIDTSVLTLDEVVSKMTAIARERLRP